MAARIEAGWDHDRDGSVTIEVDEGSGPAVITISTGTYCHTDLTSVLGTGVYDDFAGDLESELNGAAGTSLTYTVTWDGSAQQYTIGVSSTGASLAFNGTAGTFMRNILGFSGNQSTATSHTSDQTPWFVVVADVGAWSDVSDDYEDDEPAFGAVADDGTSYIISRTEAPILNDFTVRLDPKANVYGRAALSTVPWTWQDFFQHCRKGRPFARIDDFDSSVHKLRPEGSAFVPRFPVEDWDSVRDIDILSYQLGYL